MNLPARRPAQRKQGISIWVWLGAGLVLLCVIIVAGGLLRYKSKSRSADDQGKIITAAELGVAETVPRQGQILKEFQGHTFAVPIPLYPGGKIYGAMPTYVQNARFPDVKGTVILEGTYDDPKAVTAFYKNTLPTYSKSRREGDAHDNPLTGYFWGVTYGPSGSSVYINIHRAPDGVSRDPRKWQRSKLDYVGGDPKETMIVIEPIWRE
jgi:hypothetical protein